MLSRQEDAGPLADAPGGYSSLRSGPEARFGQPHRTNQIIAPQPTSIRLAGIYCICSLHPVARHLHVPFTHCHQSLGCIGGNATSITMLLSQLTATLMRSKQRYFCSVDLGVVCRFFGTHTEVRQRLRATAMAQWNCLAVQLVVESELMGGGTFLGVAMHLVIGSLVGLVFGAAVDKVEFLRIDTLSKGVWLGVLGGLVTIPFGCVLFAIATGVPISFMVSFSFILHLVWGTVLGVVAGLGLRGHAFCQSLDSQQVSAAAREVT